MAKGRRSGVSYEQLPNGTYRVRWRENEQQPDGTVKRVQRSKVVSTEATAKVIQGEVIQALERGEVPNFEPVRVVQEVASVDAVLVGWVQSRIAKGIAPATRRGYANAVALILRTLREQHEIPDGKAVPGDLLTRDNVNAVTVQLRTADYAEGVIYSTIRVLVSAWSWACDDPETYPGLAKAPRDTSEMLPRTPLYRAGPAPTLREIDAVLRQLAGSQRRSLALAAAQIMRATGLRVGQVLGIEVQDVDLRNRVLVVRVGKSRREKAMQREVPIAPVLVPVLEELKGERTEGILLRRRSDLGSGRWSRGGPVEAVRRAWETATTEGLVRREVWAPPERKIARPDHAFRAAFMAYLEGQGVRAEVIDELVGHAGRSSVRRHHYVNSDPIWDAMVEAVALLPEVDWTGPEVEEALPPNVVAFPGR